MQASIAVFVISALSTTLKLVSANKCNTCKDIVSKFDEGLKKTDKSNFGGGNTRWEEGSLGKYRFSETRLLEIIEQLCGDSDKECHHMLEEHEESLENWWFKHYAKEKDTELKQYFCIERVKVCCADNTYGPKCESCPGGKERPCSGNGNCDGAGTRQGKGTCDCHSGYKGELCDECKDGYFEEAKNDTHITCTACHESCKSTCWEAGPKGCDECDSGWVHNEELGCQDINECEAEESPCVEEKYCVNTQGSYDCEKCNAACKGCTAEGASACKECYEGYKDIEGTCTDINECDESPCTGENEECVNEPGLYRCDCKEGFIRVDGPCVVKPKDYVTLYEDDYYRGKERHLLDSAETLPEDLDQKTSSIKIYGTHKWMFYKDQDFKGTSVELGPGYHNLKDLDKVGNDSIRSAKKLDVEVEPAATKDQEEEEKDDDDEDDDEDEDEEDDLPPKQEMPPLPVPHVEL